MEIGKQIKTLRLAKGVIQEELTEYLGVSFHGTTPRVFGKLCRRNWR